jgi:uncharacterized protein YegP (UPF0339 family)
MATRTYPSFWLYKDHKKEWRWAYEARNGETIAVSSEGYKRRADAERGIVIMQQSAGSDTWFPTSLANER